jgi:ferritin-like metal-binding protein YciE
MADTKDIMMDWLRDAHAMERASIDNLERQVDHLDHYPDLKLKFQQQIELTKRQSDRIDQQLKALGSDTSTLKEMVTRMAGRAQAMLAGATADEVVKQAATTLAYENWEIANFRALAAAAEREGEASISGMFEEMAGEKEEMAEWLSDNIPAITRRYLDLRATDSAGIAKS